MKKLRHAGRSVNGHRLDLHLGCGPKYLPGFVNIDANPMHKTDILLDIRCGLPFASNSVDSIYSTHMIEHLYRRTGEAVAGLRARAQGRGRYENHRAQLVQCDPRFPAEPARLVLRRFSAPLRFPGRPLLQFRLLRWTAPDRL